MRIARMAEDFHIKVIPHGWNTAVGLAADLHLASAIANTELVEYCTGSAYIDEIVAEPWVLDSDGMLNIPTEPGLGVALNFDAIRKYTGDVELFSK
jgi:D-galactarolactone cycloisomerase